MPPEIYKYKAELIKRSEFTADGMIASVKIPQSEINQYSPLYNPAPLIQNDMLQTDGVLVAVAFKVYADGKITAAIRCNPSAPVGAKLAEHFGGGGHDFAAGFKITDGRSFEDVKADCLSFAEQLLANSGKANTSI
jgi:nanoRNase/pAp phosphatase (c-di-AMP/oligoRNAs hydrolase)